MIDVVISRYNEDLSWITQLPPDSQTFVYNKGTDSNFGIPMFNIGGEQHTFIHHICATYEKLHQTNNDWVCFLHGNPFQHFNGTLDYLNNGGYKENDFTFLADNVVNCAMDGSPHHKGLPLDKFFENHLLVEAPDKLTFGIGGQFVIHKRAIHRKKFEYFMNLYSACMLNKVVPYMLERTWAYVFS